VTATTTAASVCPLDCPDRCSLTVEVADGRVLSLDGSRLNPLTDGYICGKIRKFGRRVHGEHRLLHPAVRVGPKGPGARFERVSWEEAIDLVASRWRQIAAEHGWQAVLPYWYAGSNGWLTGGGLDQRLWNRLGTTQIQRTFCAANARAAAESVYADLPSADPLDVDHASCVILWGCNPSASGIHLVPHLRAMQERGGTLIVVDPRRTPLAKQADLHLAPLPGTDGVLAMAIARVAFEEGLADLPFLQRWVSDAELYRAAVSQRSVSEASALCQVPEADIVRAARLYAQVRPAMLRCGWGVERTRNGTDSIRAVLALPAIFGQFGQRGSGWALSTSGGYGTDPRVWQRVEPTPATRTVNMSRLGLLLEELSDPPIRSIYVYDCNPAATAPDQARVLRQLAREDLFVVVHEQVHTDTVDYADVVLPATTFLEHRELVRSYGGYLVQWSEPAIPPVGESRGNHVVIRALATALGLGDEPAFDVDEVGLARQMAEVARVPWDTLQRELVVKLPSPVQLVDRFPSRPISLVGALGAPSYRPPPADAELPLILVSPSSTRAISSTGFESLPAGTAVVGLHPHDAAARGIRAGDEVRVYNTQGEVRLLAAIDDTLRPGVVNIPKGLWRSATRNGLTGNALVPAHVDPIGGGACYNDARVEIEALSTVST
jgi:anaerobic selenocysteine-containing dehydrogenase